MGYGTTYVITCQKARGTEGREISKLRTVRGAASEVRHVGSRGFLYIAAMGGETNCARWYYHGRNKFWKFITMYVLNIKNAS